MVIKYEDENYPEKLKNIPSPPKKLYVLGNEKLLNGTCISIVGSRNCTEKGFEIAKEFAKNLSMQNICIVSGMAKGIDTAAHIGTLEANGKTIAVLGSGFKHIFPEENKMLFNKILENNGAVISEYEEDIDVFPQGFVARNRIVSGLSLGILIVEAKSKSGTGITADFARKQKRNVFCIPHSLGEKEGEGTNRLIKNGAQLVTCADDILETLKITKNETSLTEVIVEKNVPEEYKPVYKFITNNPINVDELCKKTKINIENVNYILTMLELEGYIKALPGKFFVR